MVSYGFRKLLEPGFEVVGTVGDGRALLKAAEELKPDLVLVDVGMPPLNGVDAARDEEIDAGDKNTLAHHEPRFGRRQ